VIDYSDPAKPKRVGYYIGDGSSAWGAYYNPDDGYIYQGDMSRGLDVLEFLGPIPGLPAGGGGTGPTLRTCPGRTSSPLPQIVGTEQRDVLRGGSGDEIICGLGNKDIIRGGGGNDILIGGPGKDKINGGKGNDRILGNGGNDRLRGGPGRDKCVGGRGKDIGRSCEKGKI
jgi:Ca2+-binding RTX toxin-like protein